MIVVGSGIAGMAFAEALIHDHPDRAGRVHVFSKGPVEESNSYLAQGGMAAAILPEDSVEQHVCDTLEVGAGRCDPQVVRLIVEEGGNTVRRLVDAGAAFDRDERGMLLLAREGGHSQARVVHHHDITGREIVRVLHRRVGESARIQMVDHLQAFELLVVGSGPDRRCVGVRAMDHRNGAVVEHLASTVVLATGGLGQLYRYTTNPMGATGDGVAMALQAGLSLRDMEFIQFHPTALYEPGGQQAFLVSEAVRGAGARLLRWDGTPLMHGVHPRGDLAPRNVVARAIHHELERSGQQHVWLDTGPIGEEAFARQFPNIAARTRQLGFRPGHGALPVRPAAHYSCGGIRTDAQGLTDLPGLYALGECASTGLHGADRLASNSLLEALVMPRRAARSVAASTPAQWSGSLPTMPTPLTRGSVPAVEQRMDALRRLMTDRVGIIRTPEGLRGARERLREYLCESTGAMRAQEGAWAWNAFQRRVLVCMAIAVSAIRQERNLGTHWCEEGETQDQGGLLA